jgi:replication factor C small subunit
MCEEIDSDYILINGSLEGNIDTLRNKILDFASTISLHGGRKYVILDEADYLTSATQPALRNFMEEFSRNCGFILTANYGSKILKELPSRCSVVQFKISKEESVKLASQFYKRVLSILDQEKVAYDKGTVAELINRFFPDFRRTINELQRFAATGINSDIFKKLPELNELIGYIKTKNFTEARKWVSEHFNGSGIEIFREFYKNSKVKPQMAPALILILNKFDKQESEVVDKEINFCAFVAELMIEGIFE